MKTIVVTSPGRINLIGEHTDYNDGFVLPTAIDKKIALTFTENPDPNVLEVHSKDLDKTLKADLRKIQPSKVTWENYILGVVAGLQERTGKLGGFRCTLESSIPIGSGVSSSAALECGIAYGLNVLFDLGLDSLTLVQIGMQAEHRYVGTKCGIMDQFASVMSKTGQVILLDCRSLDYTYVPLELGDHRLLLLNSQVHHELASGEYNTRREQCDDALEILRKSYPEVMALRDVTPSMLEDQKNYLPNILYRRCKHVVEENQRVLEAVAALQNGDLPLMGKLLYQSHAGLRDDYEVSCAEIDFLVDFTRDYVGVLGARIMGGGFGGCSLNLIHKDLIQEFVARVAPAYQDKFNKALSWFLAQPSGGTSIRLP